MMISIKHADEFAWLALETRLFTHLTRRRLGRHVAYICPASGQTPAPVRLLLHQQNFSIAETRAAHIDFGSGVARLKFEPSLRFGRRHEPPGDLAWRSIDTHLALSVRGFRVKAIASPTAALERAIA